MIATERGGGGKRERWEEERVRKTERREGERRAETQDMDRET